MWGNIFKLISFIFVLSSLVFSSRSFAALLDLKTARVIQSVATIHAAEYRAASSLEEKRKVFQKIRDEIKSRIPQQEQVIHKILDSLDWHYSAEVKSEKLENSPPYKSEEFEAKTQIKIIIFRSIGNDSLSKISQFKSLECGQQNQSSFFDLETFLEHTSSSVNSFKPTQNLDQLFKQLKDRQDICFNMEDGCVDRALSMQELMKSEGKSSQLIQASGHFGASNLWGTHGWTTHFAVAWTDPADPQKTRWILDPSLFEHPVSLQTWLDALSKVPFEEDGAHAKSPNRYRFFDSYPFVDPFYSSKKEQLADFLPENHYRENIKNLVKMTLEPYLSQKEVDSVTLKTYEIEIRRVSVQKRQGNPQFRGFDYNELAWPEIARLLAKNSHLQGKERLIAALLEGLNEKDDRIQLVSALVLSSVDFSGVSAASTIPTKIMDGLIPTLNTVQDPVKKDKILAVLVKAYNQLDPKIKSEYLKQLLPWLAKERYSGFSYQLSMDEVTSEGLVQYMIENPIKERIPLDGFLASLRKHPDPIHLLKMQFKLEASLDYTNEMQARLRTTQAPSAEFLPQYRELYKKSNPGSDRREVLASIAHLKLTDEDLKLFDTEIEKASTKRMIREDFIQVLEKLESANHLPSNSYVGKVIRHNQSLDPQWKR